MSLLELGDVAPDFRFQDGAYRGSLRALRGTPVILALGRREPIGAQPVVQRIVLDGNRVLVLYSRDEAVAEQYGIGSEPALFVIGASGRVIWSCAGGPSVSEPQMSPGLSRGEFVATLFAASLAATFAGASGTARR
jgi:hypothetical protein